MRPIRVVLAVLVVLCALLVWGLRVHWREAELAWLARERAQRAAPVAALALAPLPVKSPLVERPGKDEFGYPRSYVDQAALRGLLGRQRYAELNGYVEQFQREFEADFHAEYWANASSEAFLSAEPELGVLLDAWIAATPTSFAPYLARGSHHVAAGFVARGSGWARETDSSDFDAMEREFALARKDLDRVLALNPRVVAALRQELRMAFTRSARSEFATIAARAFALCPGCMQPRVTQQIGLEPRWGGSYAEMADAAAAAPTSLNPRFRMLPGYAEIDRANGFVTDKQLDRALEHAERACALGENVDSLSKKADILLRQKNALGAVAAGRRALELSPSNGEAMLDLALAEAEAKDWRAAYAHLSAGLRIRPASSDARWLLPKVVAGLSALGAQAHQEGRDNDAIEILDQAAELDPNREIQGRRAAVLTSGFHGQDAELAALEAAAQSAPHDVYAHERLDYALSTRHDWPRIDAMWTRYLQDNPEDARAYVERAGTLAHEGRLAEAHADAARACELGSSAGCALAKR